MQRCPTFCYKLFAQAHRKREVGLPIAMQVSNLMTIDAKATIPVFVLGGTGYVAGELLRLLLNHPHFSIAAVISSSQPGEQVTSAFPHLRGTLADTLAFQSTEEMMRCFQSQQQLGVFAATPHGETAHILHDVLTAAERAGSILRAVDLSADFRFPDATQYEAVYGRPHPAPQRLSSFHCSLPEHWPGKPPAHATQPGCFTSAVTLAAYPFFALNLVEENVFVAAITGSSGSGRKLDYGTHHSERRSNLYAYSPLTHRHEPEMRELLGRACGGKEPNVEFTPHSGPFVRGIHATLRMTLRQNASADRLVSQVNDFYKASPFVCATPKLPRLTEVVGTNRCHLGIATRGQTLVVTSVIDNLVKGAAGGAIQWMNRLFDLAEDTGLRLPGLGWY